jgi:hypothetical protein
MIEGDKNAQLILRAGKLKPPSADTWDSDHIINGEGKLFALSLPVRLSDDGKFRMKLAAKCTAIIRLDRYCICWRRARKRAFAEAIVSFRYRERPTARGGKKLRISIFSEIAGKNLMKHFKLR